MTTIPRRRLWATAFYRLALVVAFLLSGLLLAAGVSTGFIGVDPRSPWTLWAIVLIANPFVGLSVRHYYQAQFEKERNLVILAALMVGLVALHAILMFDLSG